MAGRPTVYSDKVIQRVNEYLDMQVDEVKSVVSGESEKFTAYKEKVTVRLPTIEGLAVFLGVSRDTIYDWSTKHAEFSYIIDVLRCKQADRLINNGLSGDYNPVITKVLLTKHGYADRSELTGADGKDLKTELSDSQFNKLLHAASNPS